MERLSSPTQEQAKDPLGQIAPTVGLRIVHATCTSDERTLDGSGLGAR